LISQRFHKNSGNSKYFRKKVSSDTKKNVILRQNQHTMLLKLYEKNNSRRDLDRIVDLLNQGGVIIYPTDTTYAFGCHALKERAIERVCDIKGLDTKHHLLSVVAHDISSVSEYVRIDNDTFRLMRDNLPGPFTFILPAGNRLPKIFKNRKEVGIRIPDNSITQEICEALGAPLLSTSLKIDAHEDIEYMTLPELIDEKWGDRVDLIIDGGNGGIEQSTIINCVDGEPEIIRQGKGWL
jgi:tRNA threonylcarbamoyl adenosine modification protein (Sua5/YciO/YrdC/YwlC family)